MEHDTTNSTLKNNPSSGSLTQKDRYFRGQGSDEKVLAFFRKHWLTLLPHFALFFLLIVGMILFVLNYMMLKSLYGGGFFQFLMMFLGLFLVYYVHHFFLILIRHHLSVTILTDARIVVLHKSLYVINEKETVDLKNIQEVRNMQSGLLENIFNFGDLWIMIPMSSQGIYLDHIPNPDFHFRLINKAKQAYVLHNPSSKSELPLEQESSKTPEK